MRAGIAQHRHRDPCLRMPTWHPTTRHGLVSAPVPVRDSGELQPHQSGDQRHRGWESQPRLSDAVVSLSITDMAAAVNRLSAAPGLLHGTARWPRAGPWSTSRFFTRSGTTSHGMSSTRCGPEQALGAGPVQALQQFTQLHPGDHQLHGRAAGPEQALGEVQAQETYRRRWLPRCLTCHAPSNDLPPQAHKPGNITEVWGAPSLSETIDLG